MDDVSLRLQVIHTLLSELIVERSLWKRVYELRGVPSSNEDRQEAIDAWKKQSEMVDISIEKYRSPININANIR